MVFISIQWTQTEQHISRLPWHLWQSADELPTSPSSQLARCHHEAHYWFQWHPHNVTREHSLTKTARLTNSGPVSPFGFVQFYIWWGWGWVWGDNEGRRAISPRSGPDETLTLSWQSTAGEKHTSLHPWYWLKGFIDEKCVRLCISLTHIFFLNFFLQQLPWRWAHG